MGEAAYCREIGIDSGLISFEPSGWQISPVLVTIGLDSGTRRSCPQLLAYSRVGDRTARRSTAHPVLVPAGGKVAFYLSGNSLFRQLLRLFARTAIRPRSGNSHPRPLGYPQSIDEFG